MRYTSPLVRFVCAVALCLTGWAFADQAPAAKLDPLDPLLKPAVPTMRAEQAVLIAVARAGERAIAVGESGIIVVSDDDGRHWSQAKVPVSVTLTSIYFATSKKGWAVGHSGVILATTDGGNTWVKQLDGIAITQLPEEINPPLIGDGGVAPAAGAGDPLLDVWFADETTGFAVGAFGQILRTGDAGLHWERWRSHLPNPEGNHLYGIRAIGEALYVVGERGSVYMSVDRGNSFVAVKTPYEGSFFGLTGTRESGLVIYGLRGHAFHSTDRGRHWSEINAGGSNSWTGATVLDDHRIVLVGQGGEVMIGDTRTGTFQLVSGRQPPLSAIVSMAHDTAIAVGPRGVAIVQSPAAQNGTSTQ
jgi:photosystem II stability/assembly factor-like uncharacterized protein